MIGLSSSPNSESAAMPQFMRPPRIRFAYSLRQTRIGMVGEDELKRQLFEDSGREAV